MPKIRMLLPKEGTHLWPGTKYLMDRAGYNLKTMESYEVSNVDPDIYMKMYRAQNIAQLVEWGGYDIGITGLDWVEEPKSDVKLLMDLGFGEADVVAAISERYGIKRTSKTKEAEEKALTEFKRILDKSKRMMVASEYENLTKGFMKRMFEPTGISWGYIRSYGATESFLDDAEMIVDCTETGGTIKRNRGEIIYTLLESSAKFIANKDSLGDPQKRKKIEDMVTLLNSAKEGIVRSLLKMNVTEDVLEKVVGALPALRKPTISPLYGVKGEYALESVVPADEVWRLFPLLKRLGATGIIEQEVKKVLM